MSEKNKTFAALLAFVLGGTGLHRFYMYGLSDRWGWVHAASVPLSVLLGALFPEQPGLFTGMPLVLSVLAGFLESLVIGVTPDEKWDARFHRATPSNSRWPLAVLLVIALATGMTALIAVIARLFDLLYTGGAYG
jgi:hypothetical protein